MKISHMFMNVPSRQLGKPKALDSTVESSYQTLFGYEKKGSPYDLKPVQFADTN